MFMLLAFDLSSKPALQNFITLIFLVDFVDGALHKEYSVGNVA